MDSETNDLAGKLIHVDHQPVAVENQRFTPKKIHTASTVIAVAKETEPRRTARFWLRPALLRQNMSNHILINLDAEDKGELVGGAPASESRDSAFHPDDCGDQFLTRAFGNRLSTVFLGE